MDTLTKPLSIFSSIDCHKVSIPPPCSSNKPHSFNLLSKPRIQSRHGSAFGVYCKAKGRGDSAIQPVEKEEEEECKGNKDVVEKLECLEIQAIMGEDEGKEPLDYYRRACLFDKSSTVFQALKEKRNIPDN